MLTKYQRWIDQYIQRHPRLYGMCGPASSEIKEEFPELRIARGFVFPISMTPEQIEAAVPRPDMQLERRQEVWSRELGIQQHWWCIDPDDNVVDPTKRQFEVWIGIQYIEYTVEKHGPEPKSKCMNCGELCFDRAGICSPACETEFLTAEGY